MEWVGLVGRVEQDLERTISQGMLPADGFLPSENSLAKYYGVSRTTVREALRAFLPGHGRAPVASRGRGLDASVALCAFQSIGEKDTLKLRRELSVLLQAADEQLLKSLAPSHEPVVTLSPSSPANELTEMACPDLPTSSTAMRPLSTAGHPLSPDPSAPNRGNEPGCPAPGDNASPHPLAQGDGTGPVSSNLSGCWTGLGETQPPEPLPAATLSPGFPPAPSSTTLQALMLYGDPASRGGSPGS
jgi:hypothetical protein